LVVGKNVLKVSEEKELQYFRHIKRMTGNGLPRRIQEWESEEKRRKGRPKERRMDGIRSVNNQEQREEDGNDSNT